MRRGPKPTVSVLSHCSKWLQFKVAQRATSTVTAPISGSSSRSESARISYSRPTRSESWPPATLVVCSAPKAAVSPPPVIAVTFSVSCSAATPLAVAVVYTCTCVPPSRTRLRVCHSALSESWAGSGSMDQLGRLPLRVLSIGKYAFQKKTAFSFSLTSLIQLEPAPPRSWSPSPLRLVRVACHRLRT